MSLRLRSIFTVVAVAALMVLAIIVILAYQLPSPGEVRRSLLAYRVAPRRPAASIRPMADESASTSPATAPAPAPTSTPTDVVTRYIVGRVIDGNGEPPNVCGNLENSGAEPIQDRQGLTRVLEDVASGTASDNPYVESAIAPLGFALQRPAVRDLVTEVENAKDAGAESILDRASFYSQLARATADLYSGKTELERVSMHAYHLYVITRAVQLNPRLATDTDTLALCNLIQNAIAQPASDSADALDPTAEKNAMLRFLSYAGIAPEQVHYDPNLSSAIGVEATSTSLKLNIPWMEKAFPATDPAKRAQSLPGTSVPFFTPRPSAPPAGTPSAGPPPRPTAK